MASGKKAKYFVLFAMVFASLSTAQRGRPTRPPLKEQPITPRLTTVKPETPVTNPQIPLKPKSGAIKFPEEGLEVPSNPHDEIPLELRRELDNVADMSEFFNFIDNSTFGDSNPFDVDGRTGAFSSSGERDAAVPAKAATCIPELQVVSLIQSNDPSVLYYPSCTRIERCGGCCNSELLSCQPTKTATVVLQVVKTQYSGGKRMKYAGKERIPVEKHLACKCQCKVKEADCTINQIYNRGACRCECKNNADRMNCLAESSTRYWDANACMCRCRIDLHSPENCSTGFYYSDETCSCEPFPLRRNDIWNQPSDDHFIPRSIPKIEEQVTSSQLQPDVPKQKDAASIQRPQFIPVIAKVDDEKEEEEKKAPVERFTFVNNWRNQYFGRFTTPKRSW